jgi:hypothetical protein
MEPIRLKELRVQGYALQKKGVERHLVCPRKLRVDAIECLPVFLASVWRRQDAGQQQLRPGSLNPSDHGGQIANWGSPLDGLV